MKQGPRLGHISGAGYQAMQQFIVVYRPHGALMMETQFHGPFGDLGTADDFLCTLPALGSNTTGQQSGVKYIEKLTSAGHPYQAVKGNLIMKTAQHTPGPWHWEKARSLQHLQDSDGSCFAEISAPRIATHKSEDMTMLATRKADYDLIAAAPDLLEALKNLMIEANELFVASTQCEVAMIAIHKATGN